MSCTQHPGAQLAGFAGPFFPESLAQLRTQLDRGQEVTGDWIDTVAGSCHGFHCTGRPTTSDGYSWFRSLVFAYGGGRVVVLVPFAQDQACHDGTPADRSSAVHTRGVDAAGINEIMARLIRAATRYAYDVPAAARAR